MKKLILAGFLCFFSLALMAAPITYVLHNVVFDDGGTASGSFDWSTETAISNVSITTTAGQSRNYNVTYTNQVFPGVLGINFGVSLAGSHAGTNDYWSISFDFTEPFAGAFYLSTPRPDFFNAYAERGHRILT